MPKNGQKQHKMAKLTIRKVQKTLSHVKKPKIFIRWRIIRNVPRSAHMKFQTNQIPVTPSNRIDDYPLKDVVPVSAKSDSYKDSNSIQRRRKPRNIFRKIRSSRLSLYTFSWQCSVSTGDQILILISSK